MKGWVIKLGIRKAIRQEKTVIIALAFTLVLVVLLFPYIWKSPYIEHISFAVLDEDNSALSRKITELVKTSNYLDVNYYPSSETELEEAIKKGKVYGGLIIPKSFSKDVSLKKSPDCLVVTDGSNMMISGNALNGCATVLSTLSAGTQLKILEGSGMNPTAAQTSLGSFTVVDRGVYEPTGGYTPRMMYALVALIVQQTIFLNFIIPLFTNKRSAFVYGNKNIVKDNIKDILVRIGVVFVSTIIISFLSLLLVCKVSDLPLRGNIFIFFLLMALFLLNCLGVGIAICSFMRSSTIVRWVYYMLSTTFSFFTGAAYPFHMMPLWLNKFVHSFMPTSQLSMAIKALNLKGVGLDVLMPDIISSIKFSLFWIPVGILLYCLRIYYMRRKNKAKVNTELAEA